MPASLRNVLFFLIIFVVSAIPPGFIFFTPSGTEREQLIGVSIGWGVMMMVIGLMGCLVAHNEKDSASSLLAPVSLYSGPSAMLLGGLLGIALPFI